MKRRVVSFLLIPFLLFYSSPAGALEKEEREWQDETMYYLMVDRFVNGNYSNDKEVNTKDPLAYQGGDYKGAISKLDKLKEMGFTTLVLAPVFQNSKGGYHGYWVTDYTKLNPQFGSQKEFKQLVKEAHKRDLQVMLDFPVAQVSPEHIWAKDSNKDDWFTSKRQPAEDKWLGEMAMLDLENGAVRKELIKSARHWIKETGIDGYYLSNATSAPLDFWDEFSKEMKAEKKNFFLLGESGNTDLEKTAAYEKTGLDGITNPLLMEPIRKQYADVNRDTNQAAELLGKSESAFEQPRQSANFLDSYKTDRYTRDLVKEKVYPGTRWMLAMTYLYTIPGMPLVHYGSEIAIDGGEGADNHRLMSFRAEEELMDYITQIGELRQQLPALTRGSYEPIYDKDGMTVFKRQYKEETVIVAINNSTKTQQVSIPVSEFPEDKELRGLLSGGLSRPHDDNFTIIMERETSDIFAVADKTGINYTFVGALAAVWIIFIIFIYFLWKRGRAAREANN